MSAEPGFSASPSPLYKEVLEGLQQPQKRIPSKFFYDERGSELFEKITRLEEYYPHPNRKKNPGK